MSTSLVLLMLVGCSVGDEGDAAARQALDREVPRSSGFLHAHVESLALFMDNVDRVEAFVLHYSSAANFPEGSDMLSAGVFEGYPIVESLGDLEGGRSGISHATDLRSRESCEGTSARFNLAKSRFSLPFWEPQSFGVDEIGRTRLVFQDWQPEIRLPFGPSGR